MKTVARDADRSDAGHEITRIEGSEAPQGYGYLTAFNADSIGFDDRRKILLPVKMARELTRARRVLDAHSHDFEFEHAMVVLTDAGRRFVDVIRKRDDKNALKVSLEAKAAEAKTLSLAPKPAAPAETAPEPALPARKGFYGAEIKVIDLDRVNEDLKVAKSEQKPILKAILERSYNRPCYPREGWQGDLEQMAIDMPAFAAVIEIIAGRCQISESRYAPLYIPPILLVGMPGVGKTHFATALAEALGTTKFVMAMENAQTNSTLTGSDKHWSNTSPGALFNLIVLGNTACPVVVLDEIDKVPTRQHQYNPVTALHSALEPVSAKELRDGCVDVVFDASHVIYIATANKLSGLEGSLLSRFEIHHIKDPDTRQKVHIARLIYDAECDEMGIPTHNTPGAGVIAQLAMLDSPRSIKRVLKLAFARAALAGRIQVELRDLSKQAISQTH